MTNYTKPSDLSLIWSTTGISSKPSDFNWNKGWEQVKPPFEEMNYIHKKHDSWAAYSNQKGIPEWDNSTIYYTTSYVQVNGAVYRSKTNNNVNNNPATDLAENNWRLLFNGLNKITSSADFSEFGKDFVMMSNNASALSYLGVGAVGSQVFSANDGSVARTAIGITSFGSNLVTASSISNGQTALGFSSYGKGIIDKANGDATLGYLGLSSTGLIFVKSANADSAMSSLGFSSLGTSLVKQVTGDSMMSTMGITSTGRDIAKSASKSAAKTYLDVALPASLSTVNAGTSTTNEYVKPEHVRAGNAWSMTTTGYHKGSEWNGSMVFRWGTFTSTSDDNESITFSEPFPNACFGVLDAGTPNFASSAIGWTANSRTRFGFNANRNNEVDGTQVFTYLAFGY